MSGSTGRYGKADWGWPSGLNGLHGMVGMWLAGWLDWLSWLGWMVGATIFLSHGGGIPAIEASGWPVSHILLLGNEHI